jgi:hypothetical protein
MIKGEIKMEGTFYKNWNQTEDEFDAERMDLVKGKIERQFEVSYDDMVDRVITAKQRLKEMTQNKFQNFNLNEYRKVKSGIKDYEDTQKELKAEYKEMFGEDLNRK